MKGKPVVINVPVFETIGDIFGSEIFRRTLKAEIHQTKKTWERSNQRLKRNAFIVLDEQNLMNQEYLTTEYLKIQNKESTHSKSERECIISFVEGAIHDCLEWAEKMKKESLKNTETKVPEVSKPKAKRKPRTKKSKDEG